MCLILDCEVCKLKKYKRCGRQGGKHVNHRILKAFDIEQICTCYPESVFELIRRERGLLCQCTNKLSLEIEPEMGEWSDTFCIYESGNKLEFCIDCGNISNSFGIDNIILSWKKGIFIQKFDLTMDRYEEDDELWECIKWDKIS